MNPRTPVCTAGSPGDAAPSGVKSLTSSSSSARSLQGRKSLRDRTLLNIAAVDTVVSGEATNYSPLTLCLQYVGMCQEREKGREGVEGREGKRERGRREESHETGRREKV